MSSDTKIIVGGRGCGKTTKLIKAAAKVGGVIITLNGSTQSATLRIIEELKEAGEIEHEPLVLTVNAVKYKQFPKDTSYFVDDVDVMVYDRLYDRANIMSCQIKELVFRGTAAEEEADCEKVLTAEQAKDLADKSHQEEVDAWREAALADIKVSAELGEYEICVEYPSYDLAIVQLQELGYVCKLSCDTRHTQLQISWAAPWSQSNE